MIIICYNKEERNIEENKMKLNYKKTIFVGFAFLIICMFWQVYDAVIAKMLIDSFGLSQTASGVVMALDNILAIILLPVFGALSDKTKTKMGKRTPYILIGTILAAILITGVSLFDNAQMAKVREEGIGPVVTEVVEANTEVLVNYEKDDEILQKTVTYEKGEKAYKFTYQNETKYYENKELAAAVRLDYVGDVRKVNLVYYIGFLVMLCLVLLAMAVYRTPAVSLMPDVTPKPLRSKANAIINLMGSAGGIISLGVMAVLSFEYQSYTLLFIVLAALMLAFLGLFMWKVKEPKLVSEKEEQEKEFAVEENEDAELDGGDKMSKPVLKSFILILASIVFWFMAYNAATSKFSVYATTVLDTGYSLPLLIAQGAAIISYIPIGLIASKVGRKKTILVGIGILFCAFLLATFLTDKTAILIAVAMALAGIGWATINVNSYPMVVEMSKGNNVGKYTGIYYTASMAAQIVTPVLSGAFMDAIGLKVLFPYCVAFSVLAFITMSFVKHGDSKPIPVKKVEAFADSDL